MLLSHSDFFLSKERFIDREETLVIERQPQPPHIVPANT